MLEIIHHAHCASTAQALFGMLNEVHYSTQKNSVITVTLQ